MSDLAPFVAATIRDGVVQELMDENRGLRDENHRLKEQLADYERLLIENVLKRIEFIEHQYHDVAATGEEEDGNDNDDDDADDDEDEDDSDIDNTSDNYPNEEDRDPRMLPNASQLDWNVAAFGEETNPPSVILTMATMAVTMAWQKWTQLRK